MAGIGFLYATNYLLRTPFKLIYKHMIRPSKNLLERYGGNWALVTGASDGIGEGFCYELARRGFNIVLMSRSQDKMEVVAKKLRDTYGV